MNAQLDEELVHLADISRIPMGIEQRRGGHGVPHIEGHDLGAAARRKLQNVDVFAVGEVVEEQEAGGIVRN